MKELEFGDDLTEDQQMQMLWYGANVSKGKVH